MVSFVCCVEAVQLALGCLSGGSAVNVGVNLIDAFLGGGEFIVLLSYHLGPTSKIVFVLITEFLNPGKYCTLVTHFAIVQPCESVGLTWGPKLRFLHFE